MKMINYLLLAAISISIWSIADCQSCSNPDADVLILGAGISGIAAAHTLSAKGTKDFLILEGRSRIGGRVRQTELPSGKRFELGANWISGIDPAQPEMHPLYAILQRCGITLEGRYDDFDRIVYDSQGNRVNDTELNSKCDEYYTALYSAFDSIPTRQMANLPDISVREGLRLNGWTNTSADENFIEWFKFDWCYTEPPEYISLYQNSPMIQSTFSDFADPERATSFFISDQHGFVQVVECLASEFLEEQDPRLHLNARVNEVQWSDDCVCAKAIENGESRTYCAPYAIITFSIGVLQSDDTNLRFVPQLPQWKLDAINMFTMSHLLSIFAEFNETFWDRNINYIGHRADQRGYFPIFQNLDDKVLRAYLTDGIAGRVVRQPKEETVGELLQVLRGIYGQDNVPEPLDVVIADWDINPLFLGSYSSLPVNLTSESFAQLALPVGQLYFSGEATSEKYYAYVHGGYFAGIDTANKVIERAASKSTTIHDLSRVFTVFLLLRCSLLLLFRV